jgi:Holliday junction DNA helicase RuvA
MAADDMVSAIPATISAAYLNPGIGKKTAERGAELRDKLAVEKQEIATTPALGAIEEDVLSALTNLGYQRAAAEKALAAVSKT